MLLLRPTETKQAKDRFGIHHLFYIGDICLGKLTMNITRSISGKPYKFIWAIKVNQPEPCFYVDSLDEAKEYATEEVRQFFSQLLE